jgi:hypothetical protein
LQAWRNRSLPLRNARRLNRNDARAGFIALCLEAVRSPAGRIGAARPVTETTMCPSERFP